MYIAKKLRKQNLIAYVLYMYQVEDVIRTYDMDIERLANEYLTRFDYDDEQLEAVLEWYDGLIRMMHEEGCTRRGHVQVVRNTIFLLSDRHKELLADPQQPFYSAAYYKALPFIVELRQKGDGKRKNEIETCLDPFPPRPPQQSQQSVTCSTLWQNYTTSHRNERTDRTQANLRHNITPRCR